jgi:cell division septation protein DedD
MREPLGAVFLALILANGVYASWALSRGEPRASLTETAPPPVPTIRLASEMPERETAACRSFGTFEDPHAADTASAEVAAQGLEPVIKEELTPSLNGYLVYIETDGSRAKARQIAQELRTRAIDCHIIPTGQLADALSVGVFHRRDFADAHLKRLAKLGYDADLQMLTRSKTLYRVIAPGDACGV